jgi:omega-amidase
MQEAAAAGASLVVLPEMWNCPYSNDSFPIYAEDIDAGDSPRFLRMPSCSNFPCGRHR